MRKNIVIPVSVEWKHAIEWLYKALLSCNALLLNYLERESHDLVHLSEIKYFKAMAFYIKGTGMAYNMQGS